MLSPKSLSRIFPTVPPLEVSAVLIVIILLSLA